MKDIKFEDEKPKTFPVRLKYGYVPADPSFPKDLAGNTKKIPAGPDVVNLPIEEARRLIKLDVAERADEIEI